MTAKTGRQPAPPLQLDAPPTSGEKKEEYRPSSRTPPWREARTPQHSAPAHARVQSRRGALLVPERNVVVAELAATEEEGGPTLGS